MQREKYWLRNKKTKEIKQELDCKFIRIDPDEEYFDIFRAINEIFRHIKQSTKKTPISKTSMKLLGLEFKSKTMSLIVKKYMLIISNNRNLLCQL